MSTDKLDYVERIEALESEKECVEIAWLNKRGWVYTSSTPGCYWMWQKEISGVCYSVYQKEAARIQEYLDREEVGGEGKDK